MLSVRCIFGVSTALCQTVVVHRLMACDQTKQSPLDRMCIGEISHTQTPPRAALSLFAGNFVPRSSCMWMHTIQVVAPEAKQLQDLDVKRHIVGHAKYGIQIVP